MRLVRKYLRQYSKFRLKALNMAATNFTEPHDRKLASLEGARAFANILCSVIRALQ